MRKKIQTHYLLLLAFFSVFFFKTAITVSSFTIDKTLLFGANFDGDLNVWDLVCDSLLHSLQTFTLDEGYMDYLVAAKYISNIYTSHSLPIGIYTSLLNIVSPIISGSIILDLILDFFPDIRFSINKHFFEVHIFSELNQNSLALAEDIVTPQNGRKKKELLVFTDVYDDIAEEKYSEIIAKAKEIGAICLKKDIISINCKNVRKKITFYTIGSDESKNINQSLELIDKYNNKQNAMLFVFATVTESEMLLDNVKNESKDKKDSRSDNTGLKIRRVNEIQSLVNRTLFDKGSDIFKKVVEREREDKTIRFIILGLGKYGSELLKSLSWCFQINDYCTITDVFDKNEMASQKFKMQCPELLLSKYSNQKTENEDARYSISIHDGFDVETYNFVQNISSLSETDCIFVCLGDDDVNIRNSVNIRTEFERIGKHPDIFAIVKNHYESYKMESASNYRGEKYDINCLGDIKNTYSINVIKNSEVEDAGKMIHLKYLEKFIINQKTNGNLISCSEIKSKAEEFWEYGYNYRSSVATAVYQKIINGISVENLPQNEHCRWNAYMRSQGYIGGNQTKHLAKTHKNLKSFSQLDNNEKQKDEIITNENKYKTSDEYLDYLYALCKE